MDYSFIQQNPKTSSHQTPEISSKKQDPEQISNESFHSYTVEHPQFEGFVVDPSDYFQQISISFYAPRARSYSPRPKHMPSEKLPERPHTPVKRLRNYIKCNELQGLNSILKQINQKKQPLQLPDINKCNQLHRSPIGKRAMNEENTKGNTTNNNLMVKINVYLNGKKEGKINQEPTNEGYIYHENIKTIGYQENKAIYGNTGEYKGNNGGKGIPDTFIGNAAGYNGYTGNTIKQQGFNMIRSKSPGIIRNQIFINNSKNALNMHEINMNNVQETNNMNFKDNNIDFYGKNQLKGYLNKFPININPDQLKLANTIGVRKVQMPSPSPPLLLETKRILDNYIDTRLETKYKCIDNDLGEISHERTPCFKHQNYL